MAFLVYQYILIQTDLIVCFSELCLAPLTLQESFRQKEYHTPANSDSRTYVIYHCRSHYEISFMQTESKVRLGIFQTRSQFLTYPVALSMMIRHEKIKLLKEQ